MLGNNVYNRRWRPLTGRSNRRRKANKKNGACKTKTNSTTQSSLLCEKNVSATSKKFALLQEASPTRKKVLKEEEYLVLHSQAIDQLCKFTTCPHCHGIGASYKIDKRFGQAAVISVMCNVCEENIDEIYTSPRLDPSKKNSGFEINQKMVDSFWKIGSGHSAMQQWCASMGMNVMNLKTYYQQLSAMSDKASQLKPQVLARSRKLVRKVYEHLYDLSPNDIIDIFCSYDGTWHKRGFTSNHGAGFVIDVITGLVIDFVVLSKYCHTCVQAEKDLGKDSPEFAIWMEGHAKECCKNYSGSSSSMETAAADLMWKRSMSESNFRYTRMLSDGDAKTYLHLSKQNIYGENVEIIKEECINHVIKRMSTALRDEVKKSKVKGITLGGRAKGALTDKVITALANYYRSAIVRHKADVNSMRENILATLAHCSSTDQSSDHSMCPKGQDSWCFYNKALAKNQIPPSHNKMPVYINKTVVQHIQPIFERLSNPNFLSRCCMGLTQNSNEGLHSILWKKCPKISFVSRKKVEIAAVNTVAKFNFGATEAAESLAADINSNTERINVARDRKRKRMSDYKNQPEQKKSRVVKKYKLKKSEDAKVRSEGATYGCAQFYSDN